MSALSLEQMRAQIAERLKAPQVEKPEAPKLEAVPDPKPTEAPKPKAKPKQERPALKVGDKIKILEDGLTCAQVKAGDILEVLAVRERNFDTIDAKSMRWSFRVNDFGTGFVLANESETTQPEKSLLTREQWLEQAAGSLRAFFHDRKAVDVPRFRVSVGFPKGKRDTGKLIGQTIPKEQTNDGLAQVFISPMAETSYDALRILADQMAAVTDPSRKTALSLRFGIYQDTGEVKEDLEKAFDAIEATLGAYPHSGVKQDAHKPRDSAQTKVYCTKTGYKARIAPAWLTKHGAPICPCCSQVMKVEE